MLAAARDAAPKRRTMLDDALSGGALTYHSARSDKE
jgi:hypothetical protein